MTQRAPAPIDAGDALQRRIVARHRELLAACDGLRRLAADAPPAADPGGRVHDAALLLAYFDLTLARHHADEDRLLFPALLEAMAGSDAVCLRQLTAAMTEDHRALRASWARLRLPVAQIACGGRARVDAALAEALADDCRRHVAREDGELLPMAARLIADDELARIARAIDGIDPAR